MKRFIAAVTLFSILFIFIMPIPAHARIITYFAPKTNLQSMGVNWLNKSLKVKKLYVAIYSFTDYKIARDLIYLTNKGLRFIYRDDKQMQDRADTDSYA